MFEINPDNEIDLTGSDNSGKIDTKTDTLNPDTSQKVSKGGPNIQVSKKEGRNWTPLKRKEKLKNENLNEK